MEAAHMHSSEFGLTLVQQLSENIMISLAIDLIQQFHMYYGRKKKDVSKFVLRFTSQLAALHNESYFNLLNNVFQISEKYPSHPYAG